VISSMNNRGLRLALIFVLLMVGVAGCTLPLPGRASDPESAAAQADGAGDQAADDAAQNLAPAKPIVVITSLQAAADFRVGQEIVIQSVSVDPDGVGISRVELWVDGVLISSQPVDPPAGSFTANQPWTPVTAGTFTVEVRAFNLAGIASEPAQVPVTIGDSGSQQGAGASQAGGAYLTALTNVNVRSGPGVDYPVIGGLYPNQTVDLTGINAAGTWWQIAYPPGTIGRGWATGLAQYTRADIFQVIPVIPAPPLPVLAPTTPCDCATEAIFNFRRKASYAMWCNDTGEILPYPGELWTSPGFVRVLTDWKLEDGSIPHRVLFTNPPDYGSISGEYDLDFVVQRGDVFRSKIGYLDGAGPGHARWVLAYREIGSDVCGCCGSCASCGGGCCILAEKDKRYTGQLEHFDVNLDRLAGKRVKFYLTVYSNGPWDYDWAVWYEPRILRRCCP
jgi:hypothetical protein